jgi:hypothetical protein
MVLQLGACNKLHTAAVVAKSRVLCMLAGQRNKTLLTLLLRASAQILMDCAGVDAVDQVRLQVTDMKSPAAIPNLLEPFQRQQQSTSTNTRQALVMMLVASIVQVTFPKHQ